jgi:hypothetical protein
MVIKTIPIGSKYLKWEFSEIAEHFHVSCVDLQKMERGSGFHADRSVAKKKAFVEMNERSLVQQLVFDDKMQSEWGLDLDGSCSGFAAGYDREKTLLRSMFESVERWTLSRWIDDGFAINEVKENLGSPVRNEIQNFFDSHSLYLRKVPLIFQDHAIIVNLAVFLGWTKSGVFAGYGTKLDYNEAVDHAHVEAYRNFVIYKNQPEKTGFPYNRIRYFANNKGAALKVIKNATQSEWTSPKLKFLKIEQFENIWLSRAMMDGWIPWQKGSETRFLY